MMEINRTVIEKIYAGWLAKIIGIRLGAPVEGWSYQQIKDIYGELDTYPVNYREFAADDDSNGPLFFLRALEDSDRWADMTAQDVAELWESGMVLKQFITTNGESRLTIS